MFLVLQPVLSFSYPFFDLFRRSWRIGGSPYLDDFVIKGLPPKAAVLRHSMAWCLGVDSMVEPVVHLEVQAWGGSRDWLTHSLVLKMIIEL